MAKKEGLRRRYNNVKSARGAEREKRKAAFVAFGHQTFAVLADQLVQSPDDRLALGLLGELAPIDDEGIAAYQEAIGVLLNGRDGNHHAAPAVGLQLVPFLGRHAEPLIEPIVGMLAWEQEWRLIPQAASLLRSLGASRRTIRDALGPALSSPHQPVRDTAAKLLTNLGGKPKPWIWQRCPLAPAVRDALGVKGVRPRGSFDPEAPRSLGCWWSRTHGTWEQRDPKGQLEQLPATITYFDRVLDWEQGNRFMRCRRGETYDLTIGGIGGENFDVVLGRRRHLLYVIAYSEATQYYHCLDALDDGADPPVYSIDHDGTGAHKEEARLSTWLNELEDLP